MFFVDFQVLRLALTAANIRYKKGRLSLSFGRVIFMNALSLNTLYKRIEFLNHLVRTFLIVGYRGFGNLQIS